MNYMLNSDKKENSEVLQPGTRCLSCKAGMQLCFHE